MKINSESKQTKQLYEAFQKGRLVEKFILAVPANVIASLERDEIHFAAEYYSCIPEGAMAIAWASFSIDELMGLFGRIIRNVVEQQFLDSAREQKTH